MSSSAVRGGSCFTRKGVACAAPLSPPLTVCGRDRVTISRSTTRASLLSAAPTLGFSYSPAHHHTRVVVVHLTFYFFQSKHTRANNTSRTSFFSLSFWGLVLRTRRRAVARVALVGTVRDPARDVGAVTRAQRNRQSLSLPVSSSSHTHPCFLVKNAILGPGNPVTFLASVSPRQASSCWHTGAALEQSRLVEFATRDFAYSQRQ